ncbi:hypothetical protein HED50_20490 [Ochrobactrum oryzae]|nr:hypothetical protein [Brucella oryzae]
MFDLNDARLKPLWLRVMLVAICFGWAAFEFVSSSPGWAAILLRSVRGPSGVSSLIFIRMGGMRRNNEIVSRHQTHDRMRQYGYI